MKQRKKDAEEIEEISRILNKIKEKNNEKK